MDSYIGRWLVSLSAGQLSVSKEVSQSICKSVSVVPLSLLLRPPIHGQVLVSLLAGQSSVSMEVSQSVSLCCSSLLAIGRWFVSLLAGQLSVSK